MPFRRPRLFRLRREISLPLTLGTSVFVICFMAGFALAVKTYHQFRPPGSDTATINPAYPPTSVFDRTLNSAATASVIPEQPVLGAVVNHQLLAADFIADTLRLAAGQDIDRIILLAPNHFFAGHGYFITTTNNFATPYGDVKSDRTFLTSLIADGTLVDNPEPFRQEHGIYNILPFISKLFPGVEIVPIITRDGAPEKLVDQLRTKLSADITPRTLVIASLDFAHNQTNAGAARLDEQSLDWLSAADPDLVAPNADGTIAVDSPPTFRLFLGLMRDRSATDFTLVHHSNSARETGQLEATNVTSHITGVFGVPPAIK